MPPAPYFAGSLINPELDELRPVAEITKARTGRRPSPQTIWRWRIKGCHGVRLEAVLFGGTWCTTPTAFAAFIRGQTEAAMRRSRASVPASPSPEREPATERQLRKAGLLGPDGVK